MTNPAKKLEKQIGLFKPVSFRDTKNDVPIVGYTNGFEWDKKANCTVVYVVILDKENGDK